MADIAAPPQTYPASQSGRPSVDTRKASVQHVDLIDAIYEAGVMPNRWRDLLHRLAEHVGARGAMLIGTSPRDPTHIRSQAIDAFVDAFIAEGWSRENVRIARMLAEPAHSGFRTDCDIHTADEIATLPMYVEFLTPRGGAAGAGTVMQGFANEQIALSFEMFANRHCAQAAIPTLDALRPHLSRAALLSAQLNMERVTAAMDALANIGMPAATLDERGRLQMANSRFQDSIGTAYFDRGSRLQLGDAEADAQLKDCLSNIVQGRGGATLALRQKDGPPVALHVLAVRGAARDVFCKSAAIVIASNGGQPSPPSPDLLRALFELTPAEARVASAVSHGKDVREISSVLSISRETVKTHLKRIYQKTGVARQGDLTALICAYTVPEGVALRALA